MVGWKRFCWRAGSMSALALLSACGGGGGVNSTPPVAGPAPVPPPPAASPSPSPAPAPSPTPASTFTTSEYDRSDGPAFHNAISAWQTGSSGRGVTLAIVDSGIDTDSPEFAGRISTASADVAGSRGLDGEDDHGNMVALVAAAARNSTGIMGTAWNATVQMLRADTPGTCTGASGGNDGPDCSFTNTAIAAGVDRAVAAGARVVNLSLGGSSVNFTLRNAISRAATAGVVVVVSAGNDGDSTEPDANPAEPDPFASSIRQAGGSNVIIVGSVNDASTISAFSNRAGAEAAWFLSALGERVCCVYENGVLETTTNAQGTFVTVVSGTSFAAPQVSGAVALLAQAFPNLTGAQIVDLLLRTARDVGPAGTDNVYGRGVLDIAAAFAPQGTLSLAGTQSAVSLASLAGNTSPAAGDAVQSAAMSAVVLDTYQRAYGMDLAARLRSAPVQQRLHDALAGQGHAVTLGGNGVALAFTVDGRQRHAMPMRLELADAEQARVLAGSVVARLGSERTIGFGWRQGSAGLSARMRGAAEPAFLIAPSATGEAGFRQEIAAAVAYRQRLGRMGLTVRGDGGEAHTRDDPRTVLDPGLAGRARFARFGAAVDRGFGAVDASLGAEWMREGATILGGRMGGVLASGGASTFFADASLAWRPAGAWSMAAAGRIGSTQPDLAGQLASGSRILSSAWSFDVRRTGFAMPDDSLALRISQPLRIESGALRFALPVDYDYGTGTARFGAVPLGLVPRGREVTTELAWQAPVGGGWLSSSLFWRRDPGHFASLRDDRGAALRWQAEF